MKRHALMLLIALAVLLSACGQQPVCPPGSITYVSDLNQLSTLTEPSTSPAPLKIGGKKLTFDQVVEGSLCAGDWRGTVYVGCNLQILEWDKSQAPTFLKGCDLKIEPDSVIYVASHNNTPYYKGCSCHTGSQE